MTKKPIKPTRIEPNLPAVDIEPQRRGGWLRSRIDETNQEAANRAGEAELRGIEIAKRRGELHTEMQHVQADYQKSLARNEKENIAEEIRLEQEAVQAAIAETEERAAKASAEAQHVIEDYKKKAKQAQAEQERAQAEKESAEADFIEAQIRKVKAKKRLKAILAGEDDDYRADLLRRKLDLETEIALLKQQIEEELEGGGEQAATKVRALENTLNEREEALRAVLAELDELAE
jgi:hypothetical protein